MMKMLDIIQRIRQSDPGARKINSFLTINSLPKQQQLATCATLELIEQHEQLDTNLDRTSFSKSKMRTLKIEQIWIVLHAMSIRIIII